MVSLYLQYSKNKYVTLTLFKLPSDGFRGTLVPLFDDELGELVELDELDVKSKLLLTLQEGIWVVLNK